LVAQSGTVLAAAIVVDTFDDELNADGDCSLREAIQAVNTNLAFDRCTSGGRSSTITLPAGTCNLFATGD
jgi:CSLREA domain-containing protein